MIGGQAGWPWGAGYPQTGGHGAEFRKQMSSFTAACTVGGLADPVTASPVGLSLLPRTKERGQSRAAHPTLQDAGTPNDPDS